MLAMPWSMHLSYIYLTLHFLACWLCLYYVYKHDVTSRNGGSTWRAHLLIQNVENDTSQCHYGHLVLTPTTPTNVSTLLVQQHLTLLLLMLALTHLNCLILASRVVFLIYINHLHPKQSLNHISHYFSHLVVQMRWIHEH